jgi:hypothetical protein
VEALVPNHFKQTFDEIYEQIDMKTEVRSVLRQPLLDACLQESVFVVCCLHIIFPLFRFPTISSRQWRKMKT